MLYKTRGTPRIGLVMSVPPSSCKRPPYTTCGRYKCFGKGLNAMERNLWAGLVCTTLERSLARPTVVTTSVCTTTHSKDHPRSADVTHREKSPCTAGRVLQAMRRCAYPCSHRYSHSPATFNPLPLYSHPPTNTRTTPSSTPTPPTPSPSPSRRSRGAAAKAIG